MKKAIKILRDIAFLISPALIAYLIIILFIEHPNLIEHDVINLFSLIIGGVLVGWFFRKEQGDSSIGICLTSGSKLYITFFLYSLSLALLFSALVILINFLLGNDANSISAAPLLTVLKLGSIVIAQKWICIYASMIIGNWLYGWKGDVNS